MQDVELARGQVGSRLGAWGLRLEVIPLEMQQSPSITKPVGILMRPLPRVWATASLSSAATEIRDSGLHAVGVTEGLFYVAVVTQNSLAAALAEGIHPDDSVEKAYDKHAVTLPPYAPSDKALELFAGGKVSVIPVVDDYGHLMGLLTPADLYPKRDRAPRPHAVGGMATPFGVYLTTGTIGAGAKGWALVSTGMAMSLILIAIFALTENIDKLPGLHGLRIPEEGYHAIRFVLFLLAFRLLPLSGIHAAEHKVVHAIERGEELTRENVRRMPRVHPRCGTNFVVGLTILTTVSVADKLIDDATMRVMVGAIATLAFWQPLGSLVQYWGTTKEPTDKQIDMGIRSGEELLKSYSTGAGSRVNIFWRLWNSGIFHVMAGSTLVLCLLGLVQWAFGFTLIPLGLTD